MKNLAHLSLLRAALLACLNGLSCTHALADDLAPGAADADADTASTSWSVFGQGTYVDQYHPAFASLYSGANSLDPSASNKETADLTLFAGHKLWSGAEFWANAEIDQGFGFSNTLGLAGFSSGEAYKVGANAPYLRLPRAFVRQTVKLGGDAQQVEASANQLAQTETADNLVFTAGKFSVVDIFDLNRYAHDPRSDFLNWSIIDSGVFDYAADPWGYTYGAAAEWNQGDWTLRGGLFELSPVPNAKFTRVDFRQYSAVTELEQRHQWLGHAGKWKLLLLNNRGDMASYRDALAFAQQTDNFPDPAPVRHYGSNASVTLNFEQELSDDLGLFARFGANGGKKETYEFTDINRSASAGLVLQGERWGRSDDRLGIAGAVNALSGDARAYFAAGGLGVLIGDGRLDYAREQIAETYYSMALGASLGMNFKLTADYQRIVNPAYNEMRGPVSVYALRLHADY